MSQTSKRAFVGLSLLTAMAVLPPPDAEAKVVKFLATTSDFSTNVTPVFVPLDDNGATSRTFNLPRSGKIVITYNAECSMAGNAAQVSIDILLNGKVVSPSNAADNGDVLCASNDTIGFDSNVRATFVVVGTGKKGTNTIRIRANLVNGGGAFYLLGEQTLLMER